MTWKLIAADCLEAMAEMDEASVDAVVTDPPYGLRFMGKAWDRFDSDKATADRVAAGNHDSRAALPPGSPGYHPDTPRSKGAREAGTYDLRLSGQRGFQEEVYGWGVAMLRVLKPGGHLLAFGGTRTYHRLASGLEDAGFEIRDCLAWLYGSGFPKSLDVSRAIDKAAGAERTGGAREWNGGQRSGGIIRDDEAEVTATRTIYDAPATPDAERWQGFGTSLKPAFEPIVLARKPLGGTVAANVLAWGTGALNVDGTRIGRDGGTTRGDEPRRPGVSFDVGGNIEPIEGGRWPANVLLDEQAAAMLDEQSGERPAGGHPNRRSASNQYGGSFIGGMNEAVGVQNTTGGASRFFYTAKSGRAERNRGLEHREGSQRDATTLNPTRPICNVCGSGTLVPGPGKTMACGHTDYRFEPSDGARGGGPKIPIKNNHPTVKPVELMQWLCRLVTPPGGLILDPFTGSGSTGIAALREGFDFIGIEREADYVEIARDRIIGDAPLFNVETEVTG